MHALILWCKSIKLVLLRIYVSCVCAVISCNQMKNNDLPVIVKEVRETPERGPAGSLLWLSAAVPASQGAVDVFDWRGGEGCEEGMRRGRGSPIPSWS